MTEDLFREDSYLRECEATIVAAEPGGIVLDRTVFYATGGGQPGDTGTLETPDGGRIAIVDTIKDRETGLHLHVPEEGAAIPPSGTRVTARIDWDRRYRLMRMHSCLHLLSSLVEGGVTGGSVGEAKSRLDFDLETPPDKDALNERLNKVIAEDHPLTSRWIEEAELDANPEMVRTMSVQPPRGAGRIRVIEVEDVDRQPCGGTHVRSTGEIGAVRIGKIEKKGRINRRINVHLDE